MGLMRGRTRLQGSRPTLKTHSKWWCKNKAKLMERGEEEACGEARVEEGTPRAGKLGLE